MAATDHQDWPALQLAEGEPTYLTLHRWRNPSPPPDPVNAEAYSHE